MTVAAVILAASEESALAPVEGLPSVRRLAEVAWAGGAMPVVVVAPDPRARVAEALAGGPASLVAPAGPAGGPVGQIAHGIGTAAAMVAGVTAALVWPTRLVWVDPETVTSLIEAHGTRPGVVLRPTFEGNAGWPVLIPLIFVDALGNSGPDRMPDEVIDDLAEAGVPMVGLPLGDPGATHGSDVHRHDLPPFEGPAGPSAGHHHEWGAAIDGAASGTADLPQ